MKKNKTLAVTLLSGLIVIIIITAVFEICIAIRSGFQRPSSSSVTEKLETVPYIATVIPPGGKAVDWCGPNAESWSKEIEQKFNNNDLWLSQEHFSGMYHAPTNYHVCRGSVEIFRMEMQWGSSNAHIGFIISDQKRKTSKFVAPSVDPAFDLLESISAKTPGMVWITIDGKGYIFNEKTGDVTVAIQGF